MDPQIRDEPVEEKEIVSGIEEVQAIPTEGDTLRKPVLKKNDKAKRDEINHALGNVDAAAVNGNKLEGDMIAPNGFVKPE